MRNLRANEAYTTTLPAGQTMTVATGAESAGILRHMGDPGQGQIGGQIIAASQTVTVGPFLSPRNYRIECTLGTMTVQQGIVEPEPPAPITAADIAIVDAGGHFDATNVEDALQEIGAEVEMTEAG